MTNATLKHPTTFNTIFQLHSIKTKATISTLAIFLIGIWSLAFYSSYTLKKDMEQALGEQQLSTVSIVASDINDELDNRLKSLEKISALITPAVMGNATFMQRFLEDRPALAMMFNAGIMVARLDGVAIADNQITTGRIGINYSDRDWMVEVLKGKPTISNPVMGKKLKAPLFTIACPIRDAKGKVIGALWGVIVLDKPNLLSKIIDNSYGRTGGYLLVSPKNRTIVFGTDKKRIMEVLPAPGINPLIDSYIQGYEGSGITIRPSDGVETLSAAKSIPVAGWYVVTLMPTKEAFAPIHSMQRRMLLAAIFLTLLAGFLSWWMLKSQLEPVLKTITTLTALSDTDQFTQPLTITRQDEIGKLIGSFNNLLSTLGQREEALRKSERQMTDIIEFLPDPTLAINREGRVIIWNKAIEKMTDVPAAEMIGKGDHAYTIPFYGEARPQLMDLVFEDNNEIAAKYPKVNREGDTLMAEVFCHSLYNNKGAWVLGKASPLHDQSGKIIGAIEIIRDITERKRAEEALLASENKYQSLFNNAQVALFRTRISDAKLVAINQRYAQMAGYSNVEDCLAEFSVTDSWADPNARIEFRRILQEKGFVKDYETEVIRRDGNHIWILFSATILPEPGSIEGSIVDITERKMAEEEKAKLEAQLQQSQKMEAIGTLAGGIAHDFNNILAAIIGYAELAKDRNQKENKEQYLQEVLKGAERAKNLVKQILTFSRQDDYTEKKPLDIKVLLKEAVKFLRSSIPTTVDINHHLTDEVCNIMADPIQMHQIIMNLCTNAAHAMREAGGTLKIDLTNIELVKDEIPNTPDLQPGHYVKLTVSDTGYGIDPDNIKKIFDPFFTTKSVAEGTGLGLSVVYGIVKGHGGAINVYSEQGKGAVFHIYLPRIIQAEAMEVEMDKPVIGGTERILFVDDETALVDIGMRMLSSLGYHTTVAESSIAALDKFHAEPHRFDLVITDMTLPKMTGIDLSRKMLKIRPDIPIILSSGIKDHETEAQATSLGIKAYVIKPLTRRELALAVRDVLDGREKR